MALIAGAAVIGGVVGGGGGYYLASSRDKSGVRSMFPELCRLDQKIK